MKTNYVHDKKRGSSLLAVSIITVSAVTVLGALAIIVTLVLEGVYGWQQSLYAQIATDSMIEDTMLQLVRNPEYEPNPEEYLFVNTAKASAEIVRPTDGSVYEMRVVGTSGAYVRKSRVLFKFEDAKPVILLQTQG